MKHWIANGARLGWLIDPESNTVYVYRPGEQVDVLVEPSPVQGDGVVAGFELVMSRVWD